MPKVKVYVSSDLKARMAEYGDRSNWPGAARAGWEARERERLQLWRGEDAG